MSEIMSDKDKMIAYLITQLDAKEKAIEKLNDRLTNLEMSKNSNESNTSNRSITMSELREIVSNAANKPISTEAEQLVKKGVELVLEGQRRGVWGI